jgi:hypothetical protein
MERNAAIYQEWLEKSDAANQAFFDMKERQVKVWDEQQRIWAKHQQAGQRAF